MVRISKVAAVSVLSLSSVDLTKFAGGCLLSVGVAGVCCLLLLRAVVAG